MYMHGNKAQVQRERMEVGRESGLRVRRTAWMTKHREDRYVFCDSGVCLVGRILESSSYMVLFA
jgi:hypothetical protein